MSNNFNQFISVYPDQLIECDCRMKCLKNINLSKISFNDGRCLQTGISIDLFIEYVIKADKCG